MSNSKRLPRGGQPGTYTRHARGRHRRPSRTAALGSQTGATILAAGLAGAVLAIPATANAATGSGGPGALAALPAGGAAAVTAGSPAPVTRASATAVLTADVQVPPAVVAPASWVYNLFSQSTNAVSNFASQVGTSFSNAMSQQAEAEIANAQANEMLARGLVQAFPYAVQGMKDGFETGIAAGTGIGVVVGGAVGAAGGTVAFPGVGTGTGLVGGGYVGGELGLIGGAGIGSAAGFIHGLVTAPTWQTLTMPSAAQDGAGQVTGLAGTGTPPPSLAGAAAPGSSMQDILNRFGVTADGQVLGSATPAAWDATVPGSQPSATPSPAGQPPAGQPPAGQPPATQPTDAPSPVPPGQQGQADTGTAVAAADPATVTSPVQQPPAQQAADQQAADQQAAVQQPPAQPPAVSDPAPADAPASVQTAGPDQPADTAQPADTPTMVAIADATGPVTNVTG